MLLKKTVYNKLVTKVNNIGTKGFVLKSKYDTYKSGLENKISDAEKRIPNTSGLVDKADYNSKICEIESRIPDINNLVKKKQQQITTEKLVKLKILVIMIMTNASLLQNLIS